MSNWPSKKDNAGAGKRPDMSSLENENYQTTTPETSRKDKSKTAAKSSLHTVKLPAADTPSKTKVETTSKPRGSSPATAPPTVGPFRSTPASPSASNAGPPYRVSPIRQSNQVPLPPINTEKQYSKLEKTQHQVEDVKGVMRNNLDKVLERGDKLGDLDARAEHLQLSSQQFAHTAKQLKKTMWWKNKRLCICIGLIVFIVLAIIALVAYFVLRPAEPAATPQAAAPPQPTSNVQLRAAAAPV